MNSTKVPHIHLAAFDDETIKTSISKKIENLHGIMLDPLNPQYNIKCTHIVVYHDSVNATEKILGALASGTWIVRMSWVIESEKRGYWINEEEHESSLSGGLPAFHRKRAEKSILSQSTSLGTDCKKELLRGGIFRGWNICIYVNNSSNNRSFRRVLAGGDAKVVRFDDLNDPKVRESLTVALTDNESYSMVKQRLSPKTPLAKHLFLRDVLLKCVDLSKLSTYFYPKDYNPTKSSCQIIPVVDIESNCTNNVLQTPIHRKRGVLRRRNRTPAPSKNPILINDVVVIEDDDDKRLKKCVKQEPDIIEVNDVPTKLQSTNPPSRKKLKFEEVISIENDTDCMIVDKELPLLRRTLRGKKNKEKSNGTANCSVICLDDDVDMDSKPVAIKSEMKKENGICNKNLKSEVKKENGIYNKNLKSEMKKENSLCNKNLKSEMKKENDICNKDLNGAQIGSSTTISNLKVEIKPEDKMTLPSNIVKKSDIIQDNKNNVKDNIEETSNNNKENDFETDIKKETGNSIITKENNSSANKIPQSATLQIIGKFLENSQYSYSSFSFNFVRPLFRPLCSLKTEHTETETSLYCNRVLADIDVDILNSYSIHFDKDKVNESEVQRDVVTDDRDITLVIQSLLWLKLTITNMHLPSSKLVGDMLNRYVLRCGIPMIQSEALAVGQYLLSMHPPDSSAKSVLYYSDVMQSLACRASGEENVVVGESLWVIIKEVKTMLHLDQKNAFGGAVSFDKYLYESHIFEMLNFCISLLQQDYKHWKINKINLSDTLTFRLLFGFCNNPAVLPKPTKNLLHLWLHLTPDKCTFSTHIKFRSMLVPFIRLIFEVVWLFNCQKMGVSEFLGTPEKGKDSSCLIAGDCMMPDDARFRPLATEISLSIKGLDFNGILSLFREIPDARHKFFLSCLFPSKIDLLPSGSKTESPDRKTVVANCSPLPVLLNQLLEWSSNCLTAPPNASPVTVSNLLTSGSHEMLTKVLLFQLHSYFQFTGGAYVVKNAVIENMKWKKNNEANKRKLDSDDLKSSLSDYNKEFRNIFGSVYKREYLSEFYKRFASDRRTINCNQNSIFKASRSCPHSKDLRFLMALLYFKEKVSDPRT